MHNKIADFNLEMFRTGIYEYKNYRYNNFIDPRPLHNYSYLKKGHSVILTQGREIICPEKSLIFVPQNAVYEMHLYGDEIKLFTLHFMFSDEVDPLKNLSIPIQNVEFADSNVFGDCFENVCLNKFNTVYCFGQFLSLFGYAFDLIHYEIDKKNTIVDVAIDFLKKNYKDTVTVKQLASLSLVSESKFYSEFKKATGMSPIQYKNKLLIQQVQRFLLTNNDLSLNQIADLLNFNSTVYLCKLFKSIVGKTVMQYKNNTSIP